MDKLNYNISHLYMDKFVDYVKVLNFRNEQAEIINSIKQHFEDNFSHTQDIYLLNNLLGLEISVRNFHHI